MMYILIYSLILIHLIYIELCTMVDGSWFNGGQNIIDILLQNTVMDQAGEWGIGILIARIGMLINSIQWLIFI